MARVLKVVRRPTQVKPTRPRSQGVAKKVKPDVSRLNGKAKPEVSRLNGKAKLNGGGKSLQAAQSSASQREKLTRERTQVMEELTRLRAELQEAPDPTGDEADSNVYEREKTLGLVAAYELRLEKIDLALVAADKGQYGICQRCGKPIDPARLKIFPETRYDVVCQSELERQARRRIA